MKNPFSLIMAVLLLTPPVLCVFAAELPEVLVTAKPQSPGSTVLTGRDLRAVPGSTLADALAWSCETDAARRGPALADLTLNASTFEQVGLFLDGLPVRDPQTGHFNLEPLLPLDLVERVEISPLPWGSRGLAGSVNVVTRKPDARGARLEGSAGSFGYRRGGASLLLPPVAVWGILDESDGWKKDTDQRGVQAGGTVHLKNLLDSRLSSSYNTRRFGADDFYGDFPSYDEWEETGHGFISWCGRLGTDDVVWEPGLYWRRHQDRFLLDRLGRSTYENRHITQVTGAQIRYRSQNLRGSFHGKGERLNSSNLGVRSRGSGGVDGLLESDQGSLGMEVDLLGRGVVQASPLLETKAWLTEEVRVSGSISRSYREPSFTELYYRDPQNAGDPGLRPESAWSYRLSPEWVGGRFIVGSDGFFRLERGLIDWARSDASQPWRTLNIGEARVRGISGRVEWRAEGFRTLLAYHGLDRDADLKGLASKYALNYPRHKAEWMGYADWGPLGLSARAGRVWRTDRQVYDLIEGKVSFNTRVGSMFFSVTNLLDEDYQEVGGVPMPGRAFGYGVDLSI